MAGPCGRTVVTSMSGIPVPRSQRHYRSFERTLYVTRVMLFKFRGWFSTYYVSTRATACCVLAEQRGVDVVGQELVILGRRHGLDVRERVS